MTSSDLAKISEKLDQLSAATIMGKGASWAESCLGGALVVRTSAQPQSDPRECQRKYEWC
jgi:hypothetical protein